jgi:hypothetical protein
LEQTVIVAPTPATETAVTIGPHHDGKFGGQIGDFGGKESVGRSLKLHHATSLIIVQPTDTRIVQRRLPTITGTVLRHGIRIVERIEVFEARNLGLELGASRNG